MDRIPEPFPGDTWEEAEALDRMERPESIEAIAHRAVGLAPSSGFVLDFGTLTSRIPIEILKENLNLQAIVTDTSLNRMKISGSNIADADLNHKAWIRQIDTVSLPFPDATFDMAISNNFLHRLADPLPLLKELQRVCKPSAGFLFKDWLRPESDEDTQEWVQAVAASFDEYQQRLLRCSLTAAFTLQEVGLLLRDAGFRNVQVTRHGIARWQAERRWNA